MALDDGLSLAQQVEQAAAAEGLPRDQLRRALEINAQRGMWTPRPKSDRVAVVEGGGHRWVLFGGVETHDDGRLVFAFLPATEGTPLVRLEMDDSGLHPVIGRLDVLATEGSDRGVTSVTLRSLPLPRLLDAARAHAAESSTAGEDPAAVKRLRGRLDRLRKKEPAPRGPRGYSDAHYQRIALAYYELYRAGVRRGILQQIAEQEGVSREAVRDWVHEARTRQFLQPATPGRPSAEPGPRLFAEEER